MSRFIKVIIPIGSFLLGGAGTYFGLDAYEKRQESYYSAFYEGLPEIQGISDPVERGRQLRKLKELAENGYKNTFFRDIDSLIGSAAEAATAEENAAAEAEKAALRQAQEAERQAREAEARRLAKEAADRRRAEEAAQAAARADALRRLDDEKVCRNANCSSYILR